MNAGRARRFRARRFRAQRGRRARSDAPYHRGIYIPIAFHEWYNFMRF